MFCKMGNCEDMPGSCTAKSCRGHEVDIMHFSIGTAIPGGLYGGNPIENNFSMGSDRYQSLHSSLMIDFCLSYVISDLVGLIIWLTHMHGTRIASILMVSFHF